MVIFNFIFRTNFKATSPSSPPHVPAHTLSAMSCCHYCCSSTYRKSMCSSGYRSGANSDRSSFYTLALSLSLSPYPFHSLVAVSSNLRHQTFIIYQFFNELFSSHAVKSNISGRSAYLYSRYSVHYIHPRQNALTFISIPARAMIMMRW